MNSSAAAKRNIFDIAHCNFLAGVSLAHSHLREKYRGEWERLREMFYIFYRQSFPRVLRKAFGSLKSLIHCVEYRDSPGIQIAIPRLTTDTVESRSLNWQTLTWIFSYNESIIIYILVNLCKERDSYRNCEPAVCFSSPDDFLSRVSLKSWRSERIITTCSIPSAKFRTVHSVSLQLKAS